MCALVNTEIVNSELFRLCGFVRFIGQCFPVMNAVCYAPRPPEDCVIILDSQGHELGREIIRQNYAASDGASL